MSVLQRFEKRLENLVEGAFAKVFKGVVHPVEIASAMQREAEAHKAILGGGRTLVPNRYVIDLSPYDHGRLAQYAAALAQELAQAQAEHIGENGWTVYGDVIVEIERGDGLDTGMFRVTAEVYTGGEPAQQPPMGPTSGAPAMGPTSGAPAMGPTSGAPSPGMPPPGYGPPQGGMPPGPPPGPPGYPAQQPQYEASQYDQSQGYASSPTPPVAPMGAPQNARLMSSDGRQYAIAIGSTVMGRGEQAQMRLPDVGISRRHARLDFDGTRVVLTDLGSTNGTLVNGSRVSVVALNPGDVVQLGTTTLTFRVDG